jgi:hypothetical protein
MKSLAAKVLFFLVMIMVVPLVASSLALFMLNRSNMRSQIVSKLELTVKTKASLIDDVMVIFKKQAEFLGNFDAIKYAGTETLQNQGNHLEKAWDLLHAYQESQWGFYHHIYLADLNGVVFLSPNHSPSDASLSALSENTQSGHHG